VYIVQVFADQTCDNCCGNEFKDPQEYGDGFGSSTHVCDEKVG
jgi:hypothetical protein